MTALWHALSDPWTDPIVRRAAAELALVGAAGAVLGCWVVLQDLAYGAESLSHGLLPGLVAAALLGIPLGLGAAVGALVAALGIALAARLEVVEHDTAVGVVVTTLVGVGALLALSPATPPRIDALLFGDVLGVAAGDLVAAGALAVVVIGTLAVLHPRLVVAGFDRRGARALGVRPALTDAALLGLLALTVVVAVRGLGSLLAVALLVAPAAAARVLARRLVPMMALAVALALVAGIGALYVSYYAGVAAGAAVALLSVGEWLAARAVRSNA